MRRSRWPSVDASAGQVLMLVVAKWSASLQFIKEILLKDVFITSIHKIIEFGTYVGWRNYVLNNSELNKILTQNKDKTVRLLAS